MGLVHLILSHRNKQNPLLFQDSGKDRLVTEIAHRLKVHVALSCVVCAADTQPSGSCFHYQLFVI